jgi:hypothetical protein
MVSKTTMPRNFLQSLAAVVAGNAIYFLIMPYLPRAARHSAFRTFDLGIFIDFGICVAMYGVLELISRSRASRKARR